MLDKLKLDLEKLSDPVKKKDLQRFFKTGKGDYGEGDIFIGVSVPNERLIAKKYFKELVLRDVQELLSSEIHEHRQVALFVMRLKYEKTKFKDEKEEIVNLYLRNTKYINNWDLVDSSAHYILGDYLLHKNKDRKILYEFVKSKNLWERRISIMTTFQFIKNNDYKDTLKISEILLNDKHDLIHKAVGWMLREIGNRDLRVEEEFLMKYYKKMPRTMLRYAIEKFDKKRKEFYMTKE